jgi:hypothetical protein
MARIYYRDDGSIYGTHTGPFTKHALPDGLAFLDVPGTPDAIVWPAVNGAPGTEQTSRVTAGVLVGDPSRVPPPTKRALAVAAITALVAKGKTDPDLQGVLVAIKDALA